MRKFAGTIITLGLVSSLVFGGAFMSRSQAVICSSPTGQHYFYSHQKNGAGYEVNIGSHNHVIGHDSSGGNMYQHCEKTQHFDYCQLKCSYCGALDNDIHTHSYIIHSADNSIDPID